MEAGYVKRMIPIFSIVVPVFNEQETLEYSHERLIKMASELPARVPVGRIELLYVNDGSKDGTAAILEKICARPPVSGKNGVPIQVRYLEFSRNFGHSAAVLAGLNKAKGDAIAIIDADLQDPPELIPDMLWEVTQNWDVVYGQRTHREQESLSKKFTAWAFYRLLNFLTGFEIPRDTGDFRVITRAVRDAVISCEETEPFLRGLVAWVGFRQKAFPYVRQGRKYGETKYTWKKMFRFAYLAIVSFSSKPLRIAIYLGMLGIGLCVLVSAWAVVSWWESRTVSGWTSLLIALMLTQSLNLLVIGLLGLYLGRIHVEGKRRPRFLIRREST